ncbi:PREDICTED: uncharacterized protein LOC104599012 [Nelumbo nucifera]|uniref:Uncharacterized protein LOC104599012 n=2 Tax=Nelumbo nucifera TaxID=4432 RepID=A0A1U8AD54_NELNU|nr:PREDICTED: uncharacterized protein LOC104599012 [Nelumbo nucifera]DAD38017.1 TPA_asm: hypothetical protein HUJ06_008658 [Nelumbo nucifera]
MEMDSVETYNDNECIEDLSLDHLHSIGSPDISDIFGDSQVFPRVGDEYQAEIPHLVAKSDYLKRIKTTNAEVMVDVAHSFCVGLPIPIMWVNNNEIGKIKCESLESLAELDKNGSVQSVTSKDCQINSNNIDSKLKVEPLDVALNHGKGLRESENQKFMMVGDQIDSKFPLQQQNKSAQYNDSAKGDYPVPGSSSEPWSDIEKKSFILGLYIFGKNLVQVKRFIGSKAMGDILSFYYGKFYRSDGHRRWSECRKMRSRRSVHGQRIFTGWRQQELLSRLLMNVPEERKSALLEVFKTFGEGKFSLEEYISTLKDTVSMNVLIEAVGVGKGKQDLTGIIMEPLRTSQVISSRAEIPIGKACSSLTSKDIIKFLTGDFRLSKARSNDLFWEAVWPRLLARGWHSEQPKNHGFSVSKNLLVFLVPGVKKFSRRKLVKGNHYFDSVSDVLSKVASDPRLLELGAEAARGSGDKEEYGWETLDHDGLSNRQRHCYLRPRLSNCNSDLMKFTVVDTSLVHGEGQCKVRELRNLPVDTTNSSTSISPSRETDRDTSDEPTDEPDSADRLSNDQRDTNISNQTCISDKVIQSELSDCAVGLAMQETLKAKTDPVNVPMNNHKDPSVHTSNDKNQRKCQISRKTKSGQSNYLAPITKQRRLTACNRTTNNYSIGPGQKQDEPHRQLDSPDASENMVSQVGMSLDKASSTSSSAKESPIEHNEGIVSQNFFGTELPHEKPQTRALIDLNLPHVPPDFETDESFMEVADSQDDPSAKGSSIPSERQHTEESEALRLKSVAIAEEQPIANARRHSTRNRPLTTRALEALACGFFNTKRRRRGPEALSHENSISRPSRRARGKVGVSTRIVDSKLEEGVVDGESSTSSKVMDLEVLNELLGVRNPAYHPEVMMCKDNMSG